MQILIALQCFNAAKYIIHNVELKSVKDRPSPGNGESHASIGLMIGTPCEILEYIEEGSVVPAEIRYLVSIHYHILVWEFYVESLRLPVLWSSWH